MALIGTLNQAVLNSRISSSQYNSNMAAIKASVNNVEAEQVADDTLTNAKISSTAAIRLTKISSSDADELLSNLLGKYIKGCRIYRYDSTHVGCEPGEIVINGKLRRNTAAITDITYPAVDNDDWIDIWALADSETTTFTCEAVDSGTAPGGSSNPGTNGRLIGSIKYDDGTNKINCTRNFRGDCIEGWDYFQGDNTAVIDTTIVFGATFTTTPKVDIALAGSKNAIPTGPDSPNNIADGAAMSVPISINTTQCTARSEIETGDTFQSADYFVLNWTARGNFS